MKHIGNTIVLTDGETPFKGKRSQATFNKAHNVIAIDVDPETKEETVRIVKVRSADKFKAVNPLVYKEEFITHWIDDDPAKEELDQNPDGSFFIPIYLVERKLSALDDHWGTENFKFQLMYHPSGQLFAVDGSLEVVVTYGGKTRRLVGAATIPIAVDFDFDKNNSNLNFGATVKSECIKNAVKAIGNAFGASLNDRNIIVHPLLDVRKNGKSKPSAIDLEPDAAMQAKYNDAYERNDLRIGDAIHAVYPNIEYTGNKPR